MFCPPNVTLQIFWVNHGVNQCFFDTVSVNLYAGLLLVFGVVQWVQYSKNSSPIPPESRPNSFGFSMQVVLSIIMPILAVVRFCLQSTVLGNKLLYGYMLLYFGLNVLCWPFSLLLIFMERKKKLSNHTKVGHGYLLLSFWTLTFLTENLAFVSYNSTDWWFHFTSISDYLEFSLFALRYVSTCLIFTLGICAPGIIHEYGAVRLNGDDAEPVTNAATESTWKGLWKKMTILFPFMWPRKNIVLQIVVFICLILLLLGRVTNVIVPIYYKLIVNSLGGDGRNPEFCWELILIYVFVKFLQGGGTGGMGVLNNLRSLLWISVQQFTTREIQIQLFAHLHNLSLRWHLSRKTGEVVRIMDRGTNSINQLLSYIVFSILPTVFDIIIAIIYFTTAFNIWFGVIVFFTMAAYLR